MTDHIDLTSSQGAGTQRPIALLPAPSQPSPCACPDAVLAAALDAIASLEDAELEIVLTVAEASRPNVRFALHAALEAEAHRYARLSRSAFAAADRLATNTISQVETETRNTVLPKEQNMNIGGEIVTSVAADPAIGSTSCVAALNDTFRQSFSGGRVVISAGVVALGSVAHAALLAAVRGFDRFDADNDPHGEHDFGEVTVAGHRCYWKIDYYDRDLHFASPDPADPTVTTRVLILMLAEEW